MRHVFIASTHDDLVDYRAAAELVVKNAGLVPILSNYWHAGKNRRPLAECLHQVEECAVVVVLVANRYGAVLELHTM